jgi:hypothetical protein
LSQFQQDVADHEVTYFIASNTDRGHGFGGNQHADIKNWVAATFAPVKIGSDTVYDLTAPRRQ